MRDYAAILARVSFSTPHTAASGETYFEHLWFAAGCGLRFAASAVAFGINALIPGIKIPTKLNLIAMSTWAAEMANDRLDRKNDELL